MSFCPWYAWSSGLLPVRSPARGAVGSSRVDEGSSDGSRQKKHPETSETSNKQKQNISTTRYGQSKRNFTFTKRKYEKIFQIELGQNGRSATLKERPPPAQRTHRATCQNTCEQGRASLKLSPKDYFVAVFLNRANGMCYYFL